MSTIKITKVKIKRGGKGKADEVYLEFHDQLNAADSSNKKDCKAAPHKDLKEALAALRVHLAILTEYVSESQAKNKDLIDKFTVTGYSLDGADEESGFVITGYRTGLRGNTTLNTPYTRFQQTEKNPYSLMHDLISKVDVAEAEVLKYLLEGKCAEDPQGDLFDDDKKNKKKKEPVLSQTAIGSRLPHADADAMKRVAEIGKDKPKNNKRVRQTAEHPDGIEK
jgi:hypothetical protein